MSDTLLQGRHSMDSKLNTKLNTKLMFSSGKDDWATPPEVFDPLMAEFGFMLDAAANQHNHKCAWWCGPDQPVEMFRDGLMVDWADTTVWVNPPYSRGLQERFIQKAWETAAHTNGVVVMLLPARTDTKAFHRYVWNRGEHKPWPWVREIRFLKGRVKFINPDGPLLRGTKMNSSNNAAPFPSMVVVFGR